MELAMGQKDFRINALQSGASPRLWVRLRARGAPAVTGPPPAAKNVVLVHGAYADGSCWADVIPLLQAQGLNVRVGTEPATHALREDVRVRQANTCPHGRPNGGLWAIPTPE